MTTWIFTEDAKGTYYITQQKEGKKPLKLGYSSAPGLGNAFLDVSDRFEPGDIVVTPEGTSVVHSRQGDLNN